MIIVKLMGGLGNQMFQYAAGRYLSEKHQTDLKLDLTFLLDRTPRKNFVYRDYDLDFFHIRECFAMPDEIADFEQYRRIENIFNKINKLGSHLPVCMQGSLYGCKAKQALDKVKAKLNSHLPVYIHEDPYRFDPRFFCIPSHAYLEGYWQSEKYFTAIEQIIRKEFTFRDDLDERGKEMANRISAVNAVCLNVRRGDFVVIPTGYKRHGVCGISYFALAVETIGKKVSNPHFFIFSDDIDWCRTHLHFDYPSTLVSHVYAGPRFRQYLQLMIRCQHYIIPNSSFGWWAAWLNANPNKVVIAPQPWFRDPSKDTSDFLPAGWIKLPAGWIKT
jgi:hypothetical protein